MRVRASLSLAVLLNFGVAAPAFAVEIDDLLLPRGVMNLSTEASVEVPRDVMSVTLSTTREGRDAGGVQSQLKQALDSALAEAKKSVRPGQVDVQTGNFSLFPRYGKEGVLTGWQGSTELTIEGRDMREIGQLTGRIPTLSVARVAYGLSRETRETAEAKASADAIARYRAKASDYARQFGYAGYVIRQINVNTQEGPTLPPQPMPRAALMKSGGAPQAMVAADESLPVEAGKSAVTVHVSGSVEMK